MLIQQCFKGQRVLVKENGQTATILSVSRESGDIVVEFDNAARARLHAYAIEPVAGATGPRPAQAVPMRPCPQCATPMPVSETQCPSCGFQYGVKRRRPLRGLAATLLVLLVLAAIAWAIWKLVLHQ